MDIRNQHGLTEEEFIKSYNPNKYERPSVTNDVLIFTTEDLPEDNPRKVPKKKLQLLLIQRKDHPYINKWAIPGGFVQMNEDLIEGAYRELNEETGINNIYVEQLYTFGDLYLDKDKKIPRDPRTRIITVANIALLPKENMKPIAGDDAKEVMWFDVRKILLNEKTDGKFIIKTHLLQLESEDGKVKILYNVEEKVSKDSLRRKETKYSLVDSSTDAIAFDHFKMIDFALNRIRNKIEYTSIAVNLLPRLFTATELKHVYEAILGREIYNFTRKIGNMIIKTDERLEGKPCRPAQLYKFNEDWEHEF